MAKFHFLNTPFHIYIHHIFLIHYFDPLIFAIVSFALGDISKKDIATVYVKKYSVFSSRTSMVFQYYF